MKKIEPIPVEDIYGDIMNTYVVTKVKEKVQSKTLTYHQAVEHIKTFNKEGV